MTLAIAVYVPEGIVMATDSRVMVTIEGTNPKGEKFSVQTVHSDAAEKTFLLEKQSIGISAFGDVTLGGLPMARHIKRVVEEKILNSDNVETIPRKLIDYFRESFPNAGTGFLVCGYKKEGKISIPYVYYCHVGQNKIERRNVAPDGSERYGAAWSGEIDILTSIVNAVTVKDEKGVEKVIRTPPPIIWQAMILQDAIDFVTYAIRTTIDTMRFQARPKTVGGPIDILALKPDESLWIQAKQLHA